MFNLQSMAITVKFSQLHVVSPVRRCPMACHRDKKVRIRRAQRDTTVKIHVIIQPHFVSRRIVQATQI